MSWSQTKFALKIWLISGLCSFFYKMFLNPASSILVTSVCSLLNLVPQFNSFLCPEKENFVPLSPLPSWGHFHSVGDYSFSRLLSYFNHSSLWNHSFSPCLFLFEFFPEFVMRILYLCLTSTWTMILKPVSLVMEISCLIHPWRLVFKHWNEEKQTISLLKQEEGCDQTTSSRKTQWTRIMIMLVKLKS